MVLFIRNKKLEKNDIERAERASQNICTFASEKCFTYRPETREKAINDCDLRASHFLCVSETCDSSQYCVGESHSLSVQCVLLFVTLIWSYSWRFIPTRHVPETREKPINDYERAERASRNFCTFAWLRQKRICFFNRPENQKLMKKLYCERAEICGIFGSETYDSPQYSVDKSHGLSVQ